MVQKNCMSRILIVSLLGWLVAFSAFAAAVETPESEIVYRANLGRANLVKRHRPASSRRGRLVRPSEPWLVHEPQLVLSP